MSAVKLQSRPELLRQWLDDVIGPRSEAQVTLPCSLVRMWAEDALAAHELVNSAATGDRHPTQPTVMVDGVLRFKENAIVMHLLDHGGIDLNDLARLDFTDEDRRQFAQLIGYSLSGYADLRVNQQEAL